MIYDKITIAKGCVIEGIIDNSSDSDLEDAKGSRSQPGSRSSSPRVNQKLVYNLMRIFSGLS